MTIRCPIWNTTTKDLMPDIGVEINSSRAGGKYTLDGNAIKKINGLNESKKILLTSWLVEQRRLGVPSPEVSPATIDTAVMMHPPSAKARADNLLRYIDDKSDALGAFIEFSHFGNTSEKSKGKVSFSGQQLLAWTASREISEVLRLVDFCEDAGWIVRRRLPSRNRATGFEYFLSLSLTLSGYERLAYLSNIQSKSTQAFVAMWFDESLDDAYEKGIEPAIRKAGYEPLRIDRKDHNNKIDDEIIAEIRRSRFLVADFTQGKRGARGGVYYEAGFAHGINIPVIFTCRKNALKKVHFDTRQYNHIIWETPEELLEHLEQRISATVGDGPFKKS